MDPEEAQKLGIFVSSLRKTLEHKHNSSKMLLSPVAKSIEKHIMSLCGVEEIITMCNYIVSVYRKMGHSNQTRITMKSIFASLDGLYQGYSQEREACHGATNKIASNVSISSRDEYLRAGLKPAQYG